MRIGISAVPQDNVEVKQDRGISVAFLYKDVQQTTDAEGNVLLTANVQRIEYPAGANRDEIVANFNFYFDKAEKKEVAEHAAEKIAHVEALLDGSDYKLLKVADGALTQEEYEPWKALRQHWRDTVNKMRACKTVEELDAITWAETPGELPAFLGA